MNMVTLLGKDAGKNHKEDRVTRELWLCWLPISIQARLTNTDTMPMEELLAQADVFLDIAQISHAQLCRSLMYRKTWTMRTSPTLPATHL